jgi:putative transposase
MPKYRRKVLNETYRESLKAIIEKIEYDYNLDIVELEIPVGHIHMVMKSEPKVSPSDIMGSMKI